MFAGYEFCSRRRSLPAHLPQVVNARNGEVQVHQPDIRHPPLHWNDIDSNHERKFKPCKTLVQYRTQKIFELLHRFLKVVLQIPFGFGNAVVLQTMLSESL